MEIMRLLLTVNFLVFILLLKTGEAEEISSGGLDIMTSGSFDDGTGSGGLDAVSSSFTNEDLVIDFEFPIILPEYPVAFPPCINQRSCQQLIPTNLAGVKNCYCDSLCELYQDCCSDYNFTNGNSLVFTPPLETECVNVSPLDDTGNIKPRLIMAVSSCPASYYNATDTFKEFIISQCKSTEYRLPPLTDLNTDVTYKNSFCAQCNGIFTAKEWSCDSSGSPDNITTTTTTRDSSCEMGSFVEPLHALVHECFPKEVVEECPSYEVTRDFYSQQISFSTYSEWESKCMQYQKLVHGHGDSIVYRNEFCAYCYGLTSTSEVCARDIIVIDDTRDSVTDGNVLLVAPPLNVRIKCGPGKVFDVELLECRDVIVVEDLEDCANLTISCDCQSLVVLNVSEFEYVDFSTVLFNGDYHEVQLNTSKGLPVICVNISQNQTFHVQLSIKFPAGYDIITYIGNSLSIVGCALVLLTFCLFKDLRTLPAKIVLNIAITILGTDVLVILALLEATQSSGFCDAVAIILHFFVLSQFSWMTILCIEACYSFYLANRLVSVDAKSTRCKFAVYCVISWMVPLLIVVTCVVVNYSVPHWVIYGKNPNEVCWIANFHSSVAVLLVPASLLIVVQLILLTMAGVFLYQTSQNKSREDSKTSTPYLRVVLAMFFASNSLWIFGFISLAINITWTWYPFIILLSVQGFVMFFGFYGTKKVLKLYVTKFAKLKEYTVPSLNTSSSVVKV